MKKARSLIGTILAILVVVLLFNPAWLPVSQQTKDKIVELEKTHFLIQQSGRITAAHILTVLLVICVVALCYKILKWILMAFSKKNERSRTVTMLILGAIKYLAVIIAAIWGFSILGVNAIAVLSGVGIIGLILGFGAQSLIEDIITGIFIIFEGQYAIGDIIILDDFRGVVRKIGVRTTTIEDTGGNLKVVNNSDIRNFQNRSRVNSLGICDVSVAYDTDLMKFEELMAEQLPIMYEKNRDLYLSAPQYKGVQELADSGIILRYTVEVREENIFIAQRRLNRDLRVLFAEKGIEIPFPQVVVHKGN